MHLDLYQMAKLQILNIIHKIYLMMNDLASSMGSGSWEELRVVVVSLFLYYHCKLKLRCTLISFQCSGIGQKFSESSPLILQSSSREDDDSTTGTTNESVCKQRYCEHAAISCVKITPSFNSSNDEVEKNDMR
jgi:hypothetical protein